MRTVMKCLLSIAVLLGLALAASAQTAPPFFSAGVTGYEATVSSALNGTVIAPTVTVSPDRKYVGIGMRAQLSGDPTVSPFTITAPAGSGFVGASPASATPTPIAAQAGPATVLDTPGMTLVAPLRD